MYGIVLLLMIGCEEGDGSAGGGSNQTPKANVSSPSNSIATVNNNTPSGDPNVFLPTPSLAPKPNVNVIGKLGLADTSTSDGGDSSAPSIDIGSIAGGVGTSVTGVTFSSITDGSGFTDVFAMNEEKRVPAANAIANPEPVTATLSLMGLGALGMATRRRMA